MFYDYQTPKIKIRENKFPKFNITYWKHNLSLKKLKEKLLFVKGNIDYKSSVKKKKYIGRNIQTQKTATVIMVWLTHGPTWQNFIDFGMK